jgi:hypothetical protein
MNRYYSFEKKKTGMRRAFFPLTKKYEIHFDCCDENPSHFLQIHFVTSLMRCIDGPTPVYYVIRFLSRCSLVWFTASVASRFFVSLCLSDLSIAHPRILASHFSCQYLFTTQCSQNDKIKMERSIHLIVQTAEKPGSFFIITVVVTLTSFLFSVLFLGLSSARLPFLSEFLFGF